MLYVFLTTGMCIQVPFGTWWNGVCKPCLRQNPSRASTRKLGKRRGRQLRCDVFSNDFAGVGKCPFLGILNITFKYLLEIISPILGWCSIGTFTNPWTGGHVLGFHHADVQGAPLKDRIVQHQGECKKNHGISMGYKSSFVVVCYYLEFFVAKKP